jgi:hypothetical protein
VRRRDLAGAVAGLSGSVVTLDVDALDWLWGRPVVVLLDRPMFLNVFLLLLVTLRQQGPDDSAQAAA